MNKTNYIKSLTCLLVTVFQVGCSDGTGPDMTDTLVGGVMGVAAGAGAGALIGNAISNGDVAKSALVGGAIGLASGLAIGAIYQSTKNSIQLSANRSRILSNEEAIRSNEQEMGEVREELRTETSSMGVKTDTGEHIYVGPSMGAYNR